MFHNFTGINFLGKLHNTKQHIQFIKWIHDKIELPPHILHSFLTSYGLFCNSRSGMDSLELNPIKKNTIKDEYKNCDYYIFEICSIKLYERDGYQVQVELTHDFNCIAQSDIDLYNDLKILYELIPTGKKIIFQTPFRPNIIYNDTSRAIDNREIIYNTVNKFCNTYANAYLYDPSILLQTDTTLFDGDTHFHQRGHEKSFHYLYENFIK